MEAKEVSGDMGPDGVPPPTPSSRPRAHLVLQLVPPASHMRVPGIGVVEAALAQPAVEADHFALLAGHLRHKVH